MGREVLGNDQYQISDVNFLLDNLDWQKEIKKRLKQKTPGEMWVIDKNTLPVQSFDFSDFNDKVLKNSSLTKDLESPDEIIIKAKEDAVQEALKIEQIAKKNAFEFLEKARWDGNDLIEKLKEEAEKDILNLKTERTKEGYEEGFKSGHIDGFERGKQEGKETYQELIKNWVKIGEDLLGQRKKLLFELKPILIELVDESLRLCLSEISKNYKNLVIGFAEIVLKKAQDRINFKLHVNPNDFLEVEKNKEFLALSVGAKQLEIIPDSRIEVGGCLLETEAGTIDSRLTTVADQIKQNLESELIR